MALQKSAILKTINVSHCRLLKFDMRSIINADGSSRQPHDSAVVGQKAHSVDGVWRVFENRVTFQLSLFLFFIRSLLRDNGRAIVNWFRERCKSYDL